MALLDLPNEIIIQIAERLEYESEISALAHTNRALHTLLSRPLYQHNVLYGDSSAMAWGIMHGCLGTVQRMLSAGAPADECDETVLWRPMALAAIHGQEAILRLLWHNGVDIHRDKDWANPRCENYDPELPGSILLLAAEHGHEPIVRLARNASAGKGDVDYLVSWDGRTPLAQAAAGGHLSIVEFLLDEGARLEASDDDGLSPLALAVDHGHVEVVECLLARGADPNIQFRAGTTPLCWAALFGHLRVCQLLLDAMNPMIETSVKICVCAVSWAAENNHWDSVDLLLSRVDYARCITDPSDKAAFLCVAAAHGSVTLVRELLESHGYDPNARYRNSEASLYFMNFLHPTALCWAADQGHTEVVELLLAHGADPSPLPYSGQEKLRKPLLQAASKGYEQIVAALLSAGADPNDWSDDASSKGPALIQAIPFESIFRRLLEAGADPTGGEVNCTTLVSEVVASGQTGQVQMLLDRGIDLAQHMGRSSLLVQAVRGGPAVFNLLLQQNRWNSLLSPQGDNVLDAEMALRVAASTGRVDIVQFLLARGFDMHVPSPRLNLPANAASSKGPHANPQATINLLLRHGAQLDNLKGSNGELDNLLCRDDQAALRLLLDRGLNPLVGDGSLLRLAATFGNENVVKLLLQAISARGEPWATVEPYVRGAERKARGVNQDTVVKLLRQYSWRRRYSVG